MLDLESKKLCGVGVWCFQARRKLLLTTVDEAAPIWDEYTYAPSTLYVGAEWVMQGNASSVEDCATMCMDADPCSFWSWCPTEEKAG